MARVHVCTALPRQPFVVVSCVYLQLHKTVNPRSSVIDLKPPPPLIYAPQAPITRNCSLLASFQLPSSGVWYTIRVVETSSRAPHRTRMGLAWISLGSRMDFAWISSVAHPSAPVCARQEPPHRRRRLDASVYTCPVPSRAYERAWRVAASGGVPCCTPPCQREDWRTTPATPGLPMRARLTHPSAGRDTCIRG